MGLFERKDLAVILVLEFEIAASILKTPGRGSNEQEIAVRAWSLTNAKSIVKVLRYTMIDRDATRDSPR